MKKSELLTKANRILPGHFKGIYALDAMPRALRRNEMYIIFDSLVLPDELSDQIAQKYKVNVVKNLVRYQGNSKTCGMFSLYYLFHRYLNIGNWLLSDLYLSRANCCIITPFRSSVGRFSQGLFLPLLSQKRGPNRQLCPYLHRQ